MLLRLSATKAEEMLPLLQRELDRPQLSDQILHTIGWYYYDRYENDRDYNPNYESWFDTQAVTDLLAALNEGDYDVREPTVAPAAVIPGRRLSGLAG